MKLISPALTLLLVLSSPATLAHKRWLLPTDFTLSDAETVTVDFSASNNIFYVDMPMPLAMVSVLTPTGKNAPIGNPQEGPRRSSFDLEVREPGTYRVSASGPPMYFVSYRLAGQSEPQRGRGDLTTLKAELPAGATEVQFAESHGLIETFVTLDEPGAPAATGDVSGLRMVLADSHPNALYTDEDARFAFTLDGEPAAQLTVTVQSDGSRYRDNQGLSEYVTDAQGVVEISWPTAGRYLLEAALEQDLEGEIAKRYYVYFLTLDVLSP